MALIIGASIGSFLNMLIYRLPRRLSFSNPPKSFCPKCKHSLGPIDLFPLFSWLSTGGKCRYCKDPVAVRYFLVEVLCGGLFAGLWWQYLIADPMGRPVEMIFYMIATAALVSIIFIDWEFYIIPDEINAFLLVVGIGMQAMLHSLPLAFWGAIAGWGILWGIAFLGRILFRKDAMGHGDIKMMRGVGALIGPVLLLANMAFAVVAGLVIGVTLIAISKMVKQPEKPKEDSAAESLEFLGSIGLTDGQIEAFSKDCETQGRSWQEEALFAKSVGAKSYEDLISLGEPESIGSLLKFGLFYLLCLDIVALFWHGAYGLIGEKYVEENIEDDNWQPTLTTIPFGPYLAVGALVCMLFHDVLLTGIQDYWHNATDPGHMSFRPIDKKSFADSGWSHRLTTRNTVDPGQVTTGLTLANRNELEQD